MVEQETHRPTTFKKPQKSHNTGRHRSKGSIRNEARGKVSVKELTKRATKKNQSKEDRRNQKEQLRKKKRGETFLIKRGIGTSTSAPILIAIIPLQEDFNAEYVLTLLQTAHEGAVITQSSSGITHIGLSKFKQRFAIMIPPHGNTMAVLDAAKVANTILFVSSAINEAEKSARTDVIDSWGEEIMPALISQGLPTTIFALTDVEALPIKKRQDYKQSVQKKIAKWLPEEKIVLLDKTGDAMNVLRKAGYQKQINVTYRNKRPHLIAEEVAFVENQDGSNTGTLEIAGYLRGKPLSVNGLIHLPGFGDFQMLQIDTPEDPHPIEKRKIVPNDSMEEEQIRILEKADPAKQESLAMENVPDPMDAEQTWPTEEEMAEADAAAKKKTIIKRVPKGTSEYQAAWIPDEDPEDDDEDGDDEEEDDDMIYSDAQSEAATEVGDDEYETLTVSEAPLDEKRYDEEMDLMEERQTLEKIKEAKLDAQFPDEVDTPLDMLAKLRFQKYRGLASFRTSPWDPKENLPSDYGRIFQFKNFERTRKRTVREQEEVDGALPGWFIKIHVKDVSKDLYNAYFCIDNYPLIVFGLLKNEQRMSLMNIMLKRTPNNAVPIKSKEPLIFQCGFRRFRACPIFSQHTNGNKHKYERFFQPDSTVVASLYAPITFPPCPVLCYQEKKGGSLEVVARGTILSVNPDRLVIKRVVLSGHAFKVHKNSAVVRYMFYNREDINWFKCVELYTKNGLRGQIKEPLGTHGHMKCIFAGQLKSQDSILMNLYKRIFPKWNYEPLLLTDCQNDESCMSDVE